jgi:hypothetical protein
MRRLLAADLLPERAGQPVKAWVHIPPASLLKTDGSSALQEGTPRSATRLPMALATSLLSGTTP